jgi:hypothetical protein
MKNKPCKLTKATRPTKVDQLNQTIPSLQAKRSNPARGPDGAASCTGALATKVAGEANPGALRRELACFASVAMTTEEGWSVYFTASPKVECTR